MIRQGVDGVILVGRQHDRELLPLLANTGKPFIITWSLDPDQATKRASASTMRAPSSRPSIICYISAIAKSSSPWRF